MSAWLIILVGLIYLAVSAESAAKGQWAQAVIFFGYAFSNVGLYIVAR